MKQKCPSIVSDHMISHHVISCPTPVASVKPLIYRNDPELPSDLQQRRAVVLVFGRRLAAAGGARRFTTPECARGHFEPHGGAPTRLTGASHV